MPTFKDAVSQLRTVIALPEADSRAMQFVARNVCAAIAGTEIKELDDGLRRLAETIANAEISGAAVASICCGAIVENGANPAIALDATLARLGETLIEAQLFAEACEDAAGGPADESDDEEEAKDPIDEHGEAVAEMMPDSALAFQAVEPLGMGAVAMLSRSPAGRKRARQQYPNLAGLAEDLAPFHERAFYLARLLNVLDDERLIVLHPEQRKGYRVKISGVATNFELFVLLADVLIGNPSEGWLEGQKPDPVVAAVCRDQPVEIAEDRSATGAFNFWNWQALRSDGTLPQPVEATEAWIWMEGVPADIEAIERQRVVLLGPPPYQRHWQPGRCFEGMIADVRVEAMLSDAEFQQWLTRLVQAKR